jgi:hypothetical protein
MAGGKSIIPMKIKRIRTGGFIPLTKTAEAEVNISDQEIDRLIEIIRPDPSAPRIRDGNYYELTVGENRVPVDLEKVPDKYKDLFSKLKSELKIVI